MAIRSKNLNLIPILQALLKHESVARAADEVGLSQPAMSGALARLRELLDDPLLVRVGRAMRLTPKAERMRRRLDDVCAQIELVFQPETFDPSNAQLTFRIGVPDYIAYLLTATMLTRLEMEAPGISIMFVDAPTELPRLLDESQVHLAVCADLHMWPELRSELLFRDRFVAAVAKGHPLLERKGVTIDELKQYPSPSLNYDPSSSPSSHSIPLLARRTQWTTGMPILDIESQITSKSMFNGALFAARPPAVARAPESLVCHLGDILPLAIVDTAEEAASFDTCMFWSPVTDEAIEHMWLRDMIRSCLANVNAEAQAAHR
ncbi:MAG TPA: LysR substrate-binding domain-containing protein [Allosphingosinicella sp.]|nr:LysR substrate-binding domain-containing protein [Allosphingosinicella sp.]